MPRRSMLPLLLLSAAAAAAQPGRGDYFKITIVDAATRRGVPLVELKTTNAIAVYTDSNGVAAWYEPGLMDRDVYFSIRSHGYAFPGHGRKLRTTRGGSVELKIDRLNIAERLYRITGQGIYRDSILTGAPVPLRNPVLNGEVTGQDSVFATLYRGKLFWLWDDTSRAAGPLGSFAGCAATSELPGKGGLDPGVGVDLAYIVDSSGFCKQITPFPVPGMKWKYWLATVNDREGRERLVTKYQSMKGLNAPVEIGLAVFNDEKEVFEQAARFDMSFRSGVPIHPFRAADRGSTFLYFPEPLPFQRAPSELQALSDPAAYEGFSCLAAGAKYAGGKSSLDRSPEGKLRYAWKRNTPPLTFAQERELTKAGQMTSAEGLYQLRDILTGAQIKPHAGSVSWNAHRARWILIAQEDRGLADNGEIWFAESDTPVGPWVYARKIVTHDKYTFYNPTQHPFFDQDGGRLIYFEGTYSDTFSGSPVKTPWYDYNQIMYRLALDDARLRLPVPVYRLKGGRYALGADLAARAAWDEVAEIPFFALPLGKPGEGEVSIDNLFSALPAGTVAPSARLDGRWSCREAGGFEFLLALRRDGGKVSGSLDGDEIRNASFAAGRLAFVVDIFDGTYEVSLALGDGKLAGRWKDARESGAITCAREKSPDWAESPDVAPLYRYRRADGSAHYSTDPALRDPGLKRSEAPAGRVWRNPMRWLVLDPAKPER